MIDRQCCIVAVDLVQVTRDRSGLDGSGVVEKPLGVEATSGAVDAGETKHGSVICEHYFFSFTQDQAGFSFGFSGGFFSDQRAVGLRIDAGGTGEKQVAVGKGGDEIFDPAKIDAPVSIRPTAI